ncbi:DNA mismatch repair protein [Phyllosticta citricarpa]
MALVVLGCSVRSLHVKANADATTYTPVSLMNLSDNVKPIEPLPPAVVAQIKSSTAITTLAHVVLGLVQNSLDAGANKIEITVDARRGGCTVQDDGSGIAPAEFALDGGLGKAYYTSKHECPFAVYGRYGTFVASVGALSLLTITSRHRLHRSYNSITLHRSQVISRQTPAQHGLGEHGTRVIMRDLFGNMPQWESLKKSLTALLLAWQQPITLVVRDESRSLRVNAHRQNDVSTAKVHAQLRPLLSILSQTLYITPDEWSSWVPASASTKSISVKGAISLEPAPSKSLQFISLGIHPIQVEDGHNELFDEINRLFNNSSFGVNEDEPELDEREKERRLNDKRYKKDGPTRRQLQGGKKGIDRWPMFCLRISLAERAREDVLESEAKLQSIRDVLRAMITEWLLAHHFQPTKRKRRTESKPTSASSSASHSPVPNQVGDVRDAQVAKSVDEKRTKAGADTSHFTELSKIRSGKSSFYDTLWNPEKPAGQTSAPSTGNSSFFETESLLPGALGPRPVQAEAHDGALETPQDGSKDVTTTWMDPTSKETFTINSRTGTVIQQSHHQKTTMRTPASISTSFRKSLRLDRPSTISTSDTSKDSWLIGFLSTHSNPVFRPQPSTSEAIPRAIFSSPNLSAESANLLHGGLGEHCSQEAIKAAFKEAAVGENKLSKTALKSARVVSQVDRKFILAVMDGITTPDASPGRPLVVLIDQHAASERVHLESLLTHLCDPASTSPPPLPSPLFFELRHPREASLLEDLAPRFAAWGVVYAVGKGGRKGKDRDVLHVDNLPPGIRERCIERPELLLEVLREEAWRVADGGGRAKGKDNDTQAADQHPHQRHDAPNDTASHPPLWLTRTSTCPPGILSLLNSRACRSAVMFNDVLARAECEDLVRQLAGCVFPFQCAHGRPSMVPLVELSSGETGSWGAAGEKGKGKGKEASGASDDEGFVDAFRRWRRRAADSGGGGGGWMGR